MEHGFFVEGYNVIDKQTCPTDVKHTYIIHVYIYLYTFTFKAKHTKAFEFLITIEGIKKLPGRWKVMRFSLNKKCQRVYCQRI